MTDSHHPLWIPSVDRVAKSQMIRFRNLFNERTGLSTGSYRELHEASIQHREAFWSAVWDDSGVRGVKGERLLVDDAMPGARFFPDATLNFAENLLVRDDDGEAIVFRGEDKAASSHELARAERARVEAPAVVGGARRWPWRPRSRYDAEPAADRGADARGDVAGRDVVVLLA